VLIKTSFSTSDENSSTAFSDFRSNRLTVANRLASQRGIDINNPVNLRDILLVMAKNNQAVYCLRF
jgi:hypothetical protein